MDKLLLCTDLDRTLIPNGQQPESPRARDYFAKVVSQPHVCLAYVTGRHLALIEGAIAEYGLPQPDFIVADVGTSIYQADGEGQWRRSPEWDGELAADWQQRTAQDLAPLATKIADCRLQESAKQGLHKLSCYINLDASIQSIISQVKNEFEMAKIRANFIWSIDEQADIGLLDILPHRANKYEAITFLMKNHDFYLYNTIFSGDSGNDRDVLISPIKSIVVANAPRDLKQQLLTDIQSFKRKDTLYFAMGEFVGLNGNYSAGIVEGICHYFPEYVSLIC
ncbi:HAD-IIB family hydrolase [[Limnothrix rosea] IAM M-220]|uniref:HAD-IIB family hydrolase n=1 Tax=[Limnothrix rosea] IAM M-220 TaxID=454133 RepID=UPI00095F7EEB|nr:HAD-IIB family hydrolase [[Limnothrix rosea] IAM M-220]OKH18183.1 haloacid dehalogenase [[Limnothrix rosea] IAM M-220]